MQRAWEKSVGRRLAPGLLVALAAVGLSAGASENDGAQAAPDAANGSTVDAVLSAGDARRGRLLYLQCRACHSLERGGAHTVGPNLHGLFGSPAARMEGFGYSEALIASGIVWTPDTLNEWLASPSEFVPGNRMIFLGVADLEDRADLIAYMREATGSEQ
jgi:cytochrome c